MSHQYGGLRFRRGHEALSTLLERGCWCRRNGFKEDAVFADVAFDLTAVGEFDDNGVVVAVDEAVALSGAEVWLVVIGAGTTSEGAAGDEEPTPRVVGFDGFGAFAVVWVTGDADATFGGGLAEGIEVHCGGWWSCG